MVTEMDKKIYYSHSFIEQMAWVDEEVEKILKYKYKKDIQAQGRNAYHEGGYTRAISRLFRIIESDPKNQALLSEIRRAESQLIAFLYDESNVLSEREIYEYWNAYLQSYVAELEAHPMHYALVKGIKGEQNHKCCDIVFDNPFFYALKTDRLERTISGWLFNEELRDRGEEVLNVRFNDVEYSYQILERLGSYWGGWDGTPEASRMAEVAKRWYERYGAELVRISHDTLKFTCRKLSESEAKELMDEAVELNALIIDCKPEETLKYLMNSETFTLWWD